MILGRDMGQPGLYPHPTRGYRKIQRPTRTRVGQSIMGAGQPVAQPTGSTGHPRVILFHWYVHAKKVCTRLILSQ
jgi:hypothetical protein